ncbi:zinc-dependent metalloprotease family protein [Aquipuribacter nitratireducens]|uniref:Zinc-dependent metalloprotease family protein n=1 Tax=Aquipuribacter nitratireducens TaxID=650104 RepID=A0ABW0GHT0_9MICO
MRSPLSRGPALLVAVAVALPLLAGSASPAGASAPGASAVPCPGDGEVLLPGRANGVTAADAVEALPADATAELEARADVDVDVLTDTLVADSTLWLDRCGLPFYVEPRLEVGHDEPADEHAHAEAPGSDGDDTLTTAEAPLAGSTDVFALHSRPGAERVVYLDFDGHVVSGTGWNSQLSLSSFSAPAFSLDADRSTFSAAERQAVLEIWRRVADDYAPFDVDVTTEKPLDADITRSGTGDTRFGTRAVVTREEGFRLCGCGGIAYVGNYDDPTRHAYYQPAFVFHPGYGTATVADIVSHEVGHNLGLDHDGIQTSGGTLDYYSGHGLWAPIMGASTRPLTQWSRGEYPGAINRLTTTGLQDDYAVIRSYGAPARPDDHGGSLAAATALGAPAGGRVSVDGVVSTPTDSDWFTFTAGGGLTTLTVRPLAPGGNLDASLTLVRGDGTTVAADNPPSAWDGTSAWPTGLDARLQVGSLPAGTYGVVVRGTGQATPAPGYTAYGSTGTYSLTVETSSSTDLVVTSTSPLPAATYGVRYSHTLSAANGSPLTWSFAGTAPAGLTLSSAGVLGGTLTAPSSTAPPTSLPVPVRVTSPTTSVTTTLQLPVARAARVSGPRETTASTSRSAAVSLTLSGGRAPYRLTSVAVPPGMVLSSTTLTGTTVQLTGRPTRPGRWKPTVRVTDADGRTARWTGEVRAVAPVAVTTTSLPSVRSGVPYSARLTATGGPTGRHGWTVDSGSLPPGLRVERTGWVLGTTTAVGRWTVVVRASAPGGLSATRTLTVESTAG